MLRRFWEGARDIDPAAPDEAAMPYCSPSGAFTSALDPERRDELRAAVRRRLGDPTGAFTLTARAWFVRGTVPR